MAEKQEYGTLYVVATPIGNSRDISIRAKEILTNADIIAAEDTRRSMILLNKLEIKNKLISNHKFNEFGKAKYFIDDLLAGKDVAIITDAGTPCISDPGNELIKAAIAENIKVIPVPGCCAAIAALSVSGFDLATFTFYGFFPRENADRNKLLKNLMEETHTKTYVFYESPKRIRNTMDFLAQNEFPCQVCLCNDITKLHERAYRGTPLEVYNQLWDNGDSDKGEYVLVIEMDRSAYEKPEANVVSAEALLVEEIVKTGCTVKDAIKNLVSDNANPYSKNELYKASLNLKEIL